MALKGINATIETLAGLSMAVLNLHYVKDIMNSVAQTEALEVPNDVVAQDFSKIIHFVDGHSQHFLAYYLMAHGFVKVVMVYGLMRRTSWSYPFAITALLGFILYQCYRVLMAHSIFLFFLTLFDCAFLYLVWEELQIKRRDAKAVPTA
ncbi:MAG: DUF2127 domain-containing protein [Hyphomicrobiales bacterium]